MSVLREPYAVPSRVIGIFRYLLHQRGQSESLELLAKLLAPESLPRRDDREADVDDEGEGGGRDMVRRTAQECIAMGLLAAGPEESVTLNSALPSEVRQPGISDTQLLVTIANLMFAKGNSANHDFGQALAWYLTQDVYRAPGNWNEVDESLRSQVGGDRLGLTNSVPYAMLEDWACYLGFSWLNSKNGRLALTPDPTVHLRLRLPEIFPGEPGRRHGFADVMQRLAHLCPVFEGGYLRAQIEQYAPLLNSRQLSSSTAHAWLRLRDERFVDFALESDADAFSLPDGDKTVLVTHLTLTSH